MTSQQKTAHLPTGEQVPALGQGTWEMGDRAKTRNAEMAALKAGVDLGMTVIDTAEMYGEGESEKLIAEALKDRREEIFIVSKVYPHNGSEAGVKAACERSLKRLQTDRIDLYLLHWRGGEDLEGVVGGFEMLKALGLRHRMHVVIVAPQGISVDQDAAIDEIDMLSHDNGDAFLGSCAKLNQRIASWH